MFDTPINLVQDLSSVFVESDHPINLDVAINFACCVSSRCNHLNDAC